MNSVRWALVTVAGMVAMGVVCHYTTDLASITYGGMLTALFGLFGAISIEEVKK